MEERPLCVEAHSTVSVDDALFPCSLACTTTANLCPYSNCLFYLPLDSSTNSQNEDQLRRQAGDQGMDTNGDKDALISRIVAEKRKKDDDDDDDEGGRGKGGKKMKMLCDSSSSSSSSALTKIEQKGNALVVRGKAKMSVDSLPSNMHGMSAPQLRSVCASNGLLHLIPKDATKYEILSIIEAECYDDGKREKVVESEDDASDASDDGDDVQVM